MPEPPGDLAHALRVDDDLPRDVVVKLHRALERVFPNEVHASDL